jgi:hypothetical protein
MSRATRIATVTLGLAAAGAAFGALASTIVFYLAVALTSGPRVAFQTAPSLPVALLGAVLGLGAAPAAVLLLLRRVPLGLAVVGSVAGTVVGGAAGWVIHPVGPLLGALLGFVAAVVLLRMRASVPRELVEREKR